MKEDLAVLLIISLLITVQSNFLTSPPVVTYVDAVTTRRGCDVPAALGLANQSTIGPNVVALSFWLTSGPAAALPIWTNLSRYISTKCGYGATNEQMQSNLLQSYHKNGIKLIVSAFGSTNYPTSTDPTETCTALAQFVLVNKFDGVDLDYEDTKAFKNGVGAQWLITCTKVLRKYLSQGKFILTHAPQGPYFTTANVYPDGAYLTIDKEVGQLIDWYYVQYYNQGNGTYDTYENSFIFCPKHPGTAVFQLKGLKSKVGVGKSLLSTANGWVDTQTFAGWLQRANKENGWCGGAMYWQFSTDKNGTFRAAVKNALASFSGCTATF